MISDKDTNTIYFSELLKTDTRFTEISKQITSTLEYFGVKHKFLPNTKDIWARDYMPIQINKSTFIEYRYDPDYLQGEEKGYRNVKTYPDIVCNSLKLTTKKSDLIMDGGNFVKSNNCVILADKIVKENRFSYNKTNLIKKLQAIFEVENIVLIPWDKKHDDYGHSDGMVRFIDKETVLTQSFFRNYEPLLKPLKKAGLKIEYIDYNVKKKDKDNWAYLNFLQTKNLILLPKLGIDEDSQAFEQIENFFTDYKGKIAQIDVSDIVKLDGALNCISWTTLE